MSWYEDNIKTHSAYTSKTLVSFIDILYPEFAFRILQLFTLARKEGLKVSIYETYRSQERQLELFNKGATKLKTKGMHHFGVATDIVFLDSKGNPSWSPQFNWKRLGQIGKSFGLEWGGDWQTFVDLPHFQLIKATPTAQAKITNGQYPPYSPDIAQRLANAFNLYEDAKKNGFSDVSLLTLSNSLIGEAVAPVPPTAKPVAVAPLFNRDLSRDASGSDVTLLQKYLNSDPETRIASSGPGSPGNETNSFGNLTQQAVQKFQIKYKLSAAGDSGYGMVGPKTRAKLQELFGDKQTQ